MGEEGGVAADGSPVADDLALVSQGGFAADVAAVNAQSKVLEQSVVEASEETAIPDFVTTRIFVVIMNGDIFAATHGKRDVGACQDGGIVQSVADHCHHSACALQALDVVAFVLRAHAAREALDP